MCLSTVYANSMKSENAIMENVMNIEVKGDTIVLTDLMEREHIVYGTLKSANLVDGYVIINVEGEN